MTIIKKQKGALVLYQAVYQPRNPLTKEPEYLSGQPRKTKTQAKQDEQKLIKDWQKQRQILLGVIDGTMLVPDAFHAWYTRSPKAERTYDTYRNTERFLSTYFPRTRVKKLHWAQIESAAIDFAKGKSTGADSSVARRLSHLSSFLHYAVDKQIIPASPMPEHHLREIFDDNLTVRTANKKVTDRHKARHLELAELAELRQSLYNFDYLENVKYGVSRIGLLIASRTGIRPGELQMLNNSKFIWNDDETKLAFQIDDQYNDKYDYLEGRTKNGLERRTVFLTEQETTIIKNFIVARDAYLASHDFVVSDDVPLLLALHDWRRLRQQLPITNASLNKRIKEFGVQFGWPQIEKIKYYSLRHTFASDRATKVGGNYQVAAQLMGHKVKTYMEHYVNGFIENLTEQYEI